MSLDLDKLKDLVIELKVLESSDIFDEAGAILTNKESLKIMRLKTREEIDFLKRKILTILKEAF
jgi:hypothetical protein